MQGFLLYKNLIILQKENWKLKIENFEMFEAILNKKPTCVWVCESVCPKKSDASILQ